MDPGFRWDDDDVVLRHGSEEGTLMLFRGARLVGLLAFGVCQPAIAAELATLRVNVFPTAKNLAVSLLAECLKLTPQIAERTYALLINPKFGFTPDARIDMAGLRNTLAVRSEIAGRQGPIAPEKYLDLSYYERALRPQ